MSAHSQKVAEKAQKNPDLLGSTNQGTREHQSPATASKVERAVVQADQQDASSVYGNTANRDSRAIDSEFHSDTDATADRIKALGGDVRVPGKSVNEPKRASKEFGKGTLSEEPGQHRVEDRSDEDENEAGSLDTTVPAAEQSEVESPSSAFKNSSESDTPEKDEAESDKNNSNPEDVEVGPTGAHGDEIQTEEADVTLNTGDSDGGLKQSTSNSDNKAGKTGSNETE